MLGGALVLVSGAGCLSEEDGELRCMFGNAWTVGKLVPLASTSPHLVLCNTPRMPAGITTFQLMAGNITKGSAVYHSCESSMQ